MKTKLILTIFIISALFTPLRSQDDWSSARQLSRDGTYPTLNFGVPAIAVDNNGAIHAFWIQMLEVDGSWTNGFYDQIEYRRSSDGGKTWTATENLTPEYTTQRIYYMKAVCDSKNNVHLVYLRGSEVLKVMHKIYDGESWSEPYEIYPYSTKTVLLKFDGIDRLFCTWYLGSASYYSYCYLNADIPEWSEAKCVHVESNSRIDNFCLNSSGDVQAIGTYGDMFSYRPYYHLFDKESDQWIIHKEISNYEEKTLGTAIALSSKDSLYANVAVGQSLDNNKDDYLTRYLDDPEWTKPYTYGENNNWDREMYIDQNDYLHLFELHFYEGDVGGPIGLTHSIGKNRIWETVIIDSSTINGYSEPNIAFDKVNNKFYLLYMRGDTVNHISRIFFRSKQNTTGIEDSDEVIVKSHDLYQNYPNPFNSSTNISYSISQPALVKLSVYNIKGEFVKDLINQRQNKGQHSVVFKTENLNSGIYYYRLTVDGVYQETRKMLYLK